MSSPITLGTTLTTLRHTRPDSPLSLGVRVFRQHRLALLGGMVVVVFLLITLAAAWLTPYDPFKTSLARPRSNPSAAHLLGTDSVGRDLLSRLILGARASITIGVGAVAIQIIIGILVGGTGGFLGGWVDNVFMRIADVILAFPLFIVVVAAVSIVGPSLTNVILVVGLLGWPSVARLVRVQTLSLRAFPFIEAARAIGAKEIRVLFTHILPNTFPTVIVAATFSIARAILLEAALSFLGLGVQPPTPSWGNLLAEAQSLTILESMPWMWLPPGLCIMLLVLAVNFVGDGLRDALDPHTILRQKT